jgi:large subunit ribosomal protein L10
MAKTKKEKQTIIKKYVDDLNCANALFIITPTSITPNEANSLRKELRNSNANFNVVKNSLFKIALEKAKLQLQAIDLAGENAVIFVEGDASESAKTLYNFIEDHKKGKIKGGILDNTLLSKDDIEELAKLPSKEVMIATTIRTIGAPLTNFVGVLNANISNMVNVLKNISESKEN